MPSISQNTPRSITIVSLILTLYLPYLLWTALPKSPMPLTSQWQLHPQQPPANSVRLIGENTLEYVRTRDGTYFDLVPVGTDSAWVEVQPRILATSISPQLNVELPLLPGIAVDGMEFVNKVGRIRPKQTIDLNIPFFPNAALSFDAPNQNTFNAFALLEDGSLWYIENTPAASFVPQITRQLLIVVPLLIGTFIAFLTGYRRSEEPIKGWMKRHAEWFTDNEVTRLCGVLLGACRFTLINLFVGAPFAILVTLALFFTKAG